MENKVYNFFRFEDLRIYHKALDYSRWINSHLRLMLNDAISDQYRISFSQSAVNIAINIAEGSGRNKSQFVYYLKMAKSAVRECVVFTSVGLSEGYFSEEVHEESRNYLIEISRMVGALITSLQKGRRTDSGEHDDHDEMIDSSLDDEHEI
ncbi:MAG: hypothetical protein CVU11_10055 [Bacteroidetes bacterium HGW-Bacteroidetes-6]|jgi:four helix bundle protein|nr:MAG: hypothetical protein CVU11_10055 [Bacteroidetes bacterium HGW-Bacteroidetes-6]